MRYLTIPQIARLLSLPRARVKQYARFFEGGRPRNGHGLTEYPISGLTAPLQKALVDQGVIAINELQPPPPPPSTPAEPIELVLEVRGLRLCLKIEAVQGQSSQVD